MPKMFALNVAPVGISVALNTKTGHLTGEWENVKFRLYLVSSERGLVVGH